MNHNDSSADTESYREKWPNVSGAVSGKLKKLCSVEMLHERLPIIGWLPKYRKSYILQDIVAGLTVALTVIPQGIADSALAGLPPQYGLYAGFMGCFVYVIFGSCKDLTIGPTALLSLLTYTVVANGGADAAVLITFLSGCIIFLLGFLNLGFLMQFLSESTITGFINAATVTIASAQLKRFFGIKSGNTSEFIDSWETVIKYIGEIRLYDTLLGVASLIVLTGIRIYAQKRKSSIFLKYLSISRNGLVVFGGILIAYLFHIYDSEPFSLTGEVASGFPSFKLPPFSTVMDGTAYDFGGMLKALGASLISVPLVSIIELVAIAKSFSKGKVVNVTQELMALGLCNIVASFVSSIPITGSFTRSAVNNASGVKTTLGGISTGAVVLLALGVLTKTFYFIPRTSLAAVIISAMFSMMEFGKAIEIYRTRRLDIFPFLGTFIVSLWLGLDFGIMVGAAINVIFTLYSTSRPKISLANVNVNEHEVLLVKPEENIIYSSAEYFKVKVFNKVLLSPTLNFVVIRGDAINLIDATTAINLSALIEDLKTLGKQVYLWNWKQEPIHLMLRFNKDYAKLFKSCETLTELFEELSIKNGTGKMVEINFDS